VVSVTGVVRVALVDDHEIVRRGLRTMLATEHGIDVTADVGSYAEGASALPAAGVDVAVIDVRLPDGDGVALCAELARTAPDLRCVVLTAYADDDAVVRAHQAGAAAFVLKETDTTMLVEAIRQAARGDSQLDAATTACVADRFRAVAYDDDPTAALLTPQERRIVAQVSEGLMNRQIGEHLGLSEKTVKNYVSNVLAKLGMAHRSEVAVYGARLAARRHAGG
jgi:DNA-binding NarL/FixJ family response regulator